MAAAQALSTELDPHVDRIAKRKAALADKIDRSANSISANIAEACGAETKADKRRILSISIRESTELESHFVRAQNAKLLTPEECDHFTKATTSIRKQIHALRKKIV